MIRRMRLGLPFWGFEGWQRGLYSGDTRPGDYLGQYSRIFNAVEGNTTFYATPSIASVDRWARESPRGFQFCFKMPRSITHDAMLRGVEAEAESFLDRLRPLDGRLGPIMIQLPPNFGARELPRLAPFLARLPREFRYAVEFRDLALCEEGMSRRVADDMLDEAGVGRVIMDTRPLRDGPGDHPDILAARHKKPNLPVSEVTLTGEPIVRIVYHPSPAVNERWIDRWAMILSKWIREGIDPIVFVHSPSNRESPAIARDLHARISAREEVGAMPSWPGEDGESASGQLSLL